MSDAVRCRKCAGPPTPCNRGVDAVDFHFGDMYNVQFSCVEIRQYACRTRCSGSHEVSGVGVGGWCVIGIKLLLAVVMSSLSDVGLRPVAGVCLAHALCSGLGWGWEHEACDLCPQLRKECWRCPCDAAHPLCGMQGGGRKGYWYR